MVSAANGPVRLAQASDLLPLTQISSAELAQRWGDLQCIVALDPRAGYESHRTSMSLSDYAATLSDETTEAWKKGYLFHTFCTDSFSHPIQPGRASPEGDAQGLFELLDIPGDVHRRVRLFRLYFGGISTGSSLHTHVGAANFLFEGRKKWLLTPPNSDPALVQEANAGFAASGGTAHEYWFERQAEVLQSHGLEAIEFTQEAGDVLYVPPGWIHAAVNMSRCWGIIVQFHPPEADLAQARTPASGLVVNDVEDPPL